MHLAAVEGALNVLLALISRGAGVDPTDKDNITPLCLAIEGNKFACVRSLIELGADIERQDNFGRTPLMLACK
jgi:ankyrin repeat protein